MELVKELLVVWFTSMILLEALSALSVTSHKTLCYITTHVNVLLVTNCKVLVEDGSVWLWFKSVVMVSGPLINNVTTLILSTWMAVTQPVKYKRAIYVLVT